MASYVPSEAFRVRVCGRAINGVDEIYRFFKDPSIWRVSKVYQ